MTYLFLMMVSVFDMKADVDPTFQIYLCFGQSNMCGDAPAEAVDMSVDSRFWTLEATNGTPKRNKGQWYYPATPPLVPQGDTPRIGVPDYFGRTMVAALPDGYRVGVIEVAVNGADIRAFMSELADTYNPWHTNYFARYDDDPFQRLLDMAKIAQQSGVIKGVLLHQGEANCGNTEWPQYVKAIYNRLLNKLGLKANKVPLLVGEVVGEAEGGQCAEHNEVIATVPSVIPTAHVISSSGCPGAGKPKECLHFTATGYRIIGKRYAFKMLELLGYPTQKDANYQLSQGLQKFYKATSLDAQADIDLQPNQTFKIPAIAHFGDGHQEDISKEVVVTCTGKGVTVKGNTLKAVTGKRSLVTVSYTDFTGNTVSFQFYVNRSKPLTGDVNDDDVVDDKDVKAVVNHIMGKSQEGKFDVNKADVCKDGNVDAADVVALINLMKSS